MVLAMKSKKMIGLLLLSCSLLYSKQGHVSQAEVIANYINAEALQNEFSDYPIHFKQTNLFLFDAFKKKPESWLRKYFSFLLPEDAKLKELKQKTDVFLFFNLNSDASHQLKLEELPKEKMVLLMWEPPTVLPKMYQKKYQELFHKIYTWDDDLVDNQLYFKLYYPELRPMIAPVVPFEQKKLCTLVASNLKSRYPHELYSARKKAIAFFEEHHPEDFEFYGRGWDAKEYSTYKGPISDKTEVIKNYRFSICYENTCEHRGYITEKIFDCFHAGNVPVYWGAKNVEDYIPKNCFIDARQFKDLASLYSYLKNMDASTYQEYLEQIQQFLSSEAAQKFSRANFKKMILHCVLEN